MLKRVRTAPARFIAFGSRLTFSAGRAVYAKGYGGEETAETEKDSARAHKRTSSRISRAVF